MQGRVATVPSAAGTQILATMLGDESEDALAYEVPAGQRAVTISAADVMGVGGLVRPGNRVDIIGTFEVIRLVPAAALYITFYALFYALTPLRYRKHGCKKWPGALLVTGWWDRMVAQILGWTTGFTTAV